MYIEWFVVRCGSWNRHKKGTCLEEIELRVQTMLSIIDSTFKTQHDFILFFCFLGGIYVTT